MRSFCNLNELQGSKIDGEQAYVSSMIFTMAEAALRELPHPKPRKPAIALCSAGLCIPVWSFRNLNELQGSKIDREQAYDSSLMFTMAEVAPRLPPHLQHHEPAFALCSAVSCISVQSLRNFNALHGSKLMKNEHSLVLCLSPWQRPLFKCCLTGNLVNPPLHCAAPVYL